MNSNIYISVATIIKGTECSAGDGITGAQRCVILLPNRTQRLAILKRGPIGQIAAECFCALLLKAWGLNVPEAFIVLDNNEISFASSDLLYPNLKQRFQLGHINNDAVKKVILDKIFNLIGSFKSTPLAMTIDEAIDNRDRNVGNILWDGESEAWIDHAFSLGEGEKVNMQDSNILAEIINHIDESKSIYKSAIAQSLLLTESAIYETTNALKQYVNTEEAAKFVTNRMKTIRHRIANRFSNGPDLFSLS